MGKKGDLLRQQKKQQAVYTFTAAQLHEHDRMLLEEHTERVKKTCREELEKAAEKKNREIDEHLAAVQKKIDEEWAERVAQFNSGNEQNDRVNMLSIASAIFFKLLIEKFRWKDLTGRNWKNTNMYRMACLVQEEINDLITDDEKDLRRYAESVKEKYNVAIIAIDDEEDESLETESGGVS